MAWYLPTSCDGATTKTAHPNAGSGRTSRCAIRSCPIRSWTISSSSRAVLLLFRHPIRLHTWRIARAVYPILGGIEMIAMMRKHQARYAFNPRPSLAEQFDILAA